MTPNQKYSQFRMNKLTMEGIQKETYESMKTSPREIFVDMSKGNATQEAEVVFSLKDRKKTDPKVKERVKPLDKDHYNILMLFVDTVSRQNSHRKYKHTLDIFKKYINSKKKKLRAYEFFRLHSIRSYTFPNLFASEYGAPYDELWSKELKRTESYAKDAGYITGYSADFCGYSEAEVSKSKNNRFQVHE